MRAINNVKDEVMKKGKKGKVSLITYLDCMRFSSAG